MIGVALEADDPAPVLGDARGPLDRGVHGVGLEGNERAALSRDQLLITGE